VLYQHRFRSKANRLYMVFFLLMEEGRLTVAGKQERLTICLASLIILDLRISK
jgi:hypothetical protein